VFIGALVRPALSEIRLDWKTLRAMPSVLKAFRGGDDHLLSSVGRILEKDGFRMVGIKDVAPDLLMPQGRLTRAIPNADANADIARGREVLRALSLFDIGQAAIVIDGHVLGVEDIEGTDGLLARVARLRAEGRIRAKPARGVLVKAPKSGQDLRFDLPTLGPRTIEGAAAAQLAGIAIVAGNTIVAEPQAMIEAADKAGLLSPVCPRDGAEASLHDRAQDIPGRDGRIGDRLGAGLMKVLRQRLGDAVRFEGVGGLTMAREGLVSLFPIEELSIMGFTAVARKLPMILARVRETADAAIMAAPDIL